jgi:uncharacterized protein YajQ (UPF0234 family)
MASFDVVSKAELHEVDNAIQTVQREVTQRYDFKGSNASIEREEEKITIVADDQYKLEQLQGMLKAAGVKRKIDAKAFQFGKVENASGNMLRQVVEVCQGVPQDEAKKIVKEVKAFSKKVQISIRGDELRVDGKKRDELQAVIALIRELEVEVPLQFINFRD